MTDQRHAALGIHPIAADEDGGHDNLPNLRTAATGFEQVPRPGDIRLKCGDRIAICNGHDRLRRQMNHGVNFVFA